MLQRVGAQTVLPEVMLGKPHPLGRHAIDVRRGEQFLSVAAKVTVPGVVDHDENEIRLF